jgi:6-phosphogluconolactonase
MAGQRYIVEKSEFVETGATLITNAINEVLQKRQICHLMLAGGGTPLPIYGLLSEQALPWERIVCYFGDERCVPPDHPESNYRSVIHVLFPQGVPEETRVYRMRGEDDPEEAAEFYQALLPKRIDLLLLGMGSDGHIASLFPGSPVLRESERRVMPVIGNKEPLQRLTVTPLVIREAWDILMIVGGEGKADAVRQTLKEGDLPASLAMRGDWLMDREAASALQD